MEFFQYLNFDGVDFPLPDSYEVDMSDKEADSGGETEAGTKSRCCDNFCFLFCYPEVVETTDGI